MVALFAAVGPRDAHRVGVAVQGEERGLDGGPADRGRSSVAPSKPSRKTPSALALLLATATTAEEVA